MGTQNKRFREARNIELIEEQRKQLQDRIDSSKSIDERRFLGQFATPIDLATEIMSYGLTLLEDNTVDFLEPSFGTGAFFSALLSTNNEKIISSITGFEIDSEIYRSALSLWKDTYFNLIENDFLSATCHQKVNLIISNPPYVRHHFIDKPQKATISKAVKSETNFSLSGLAGLYCYFILLAHKWLKPNAISGWLIPSEFMDVNYGSTIKEYLLNKVHLLRIHRYAPENSKFKDALVSSCVVWFKNEVIADDYTVKFTYGGTHDKPKISRTIYKSQLKNKSKWTNITTNTIHDSIEKCNDVPTLGDYFTIKRGLATGDNNFFILSKDQIDSLDLDMSFFTPILPSPHNLMVNEIFSDSSGYPLLDTQYFLLNCELSESDLRFDYPTIWKYLESGKETTGRKYLCRNRKIWYHQEKRSATPFLCSYMGRSKGDIDSPFRFILNHTDAVATNSYIMLYPKDEIVKILSKTPDSSYAIWQALRSISRYDLECQGRVYGGGLKKIEPRELSKVRCEKLFELISDIGGMV